MVNRGRLRRTKARLNLGEPVRGKELGTDTLKQDPLSGLAPQTQGHAARRRAAVVVMRISRKEGQDFTARRSRVSRHVGPTLVKQDVLNFLTGTNIRQ